MSDILSVPVKTEPIEDFDQGENNTATASSVIGNESVIMPVIKIEQEQEAYLTSETVLSSGLTIQKTCGSDIVLVKQEWIEDEAVDDFGLSDDPLSGPPIEEESAGFANTGTGCTEGGPSGDVILVKQKQTKDVLVVQTSKDGLNISKEVGKGNFKLSTIDAYWENKNSDSSKLYSCYECRYRTKLKMQLRQHVKIHAKEDLSEFCTYETVVSQPGKIKKRILNEEKPYSCGVCEKRFGHVGDLKIHMRVHTGEKPYKCDVCERRFSQAGVLKNHMRIHTGEKPFICNVCEARFSRDSTLKNHNRVHTGEKPYNCSVCETRFTDAGTLRKHMRTHTGEKPFSCDVCETKFSQASMLRSHLRIHTGEKPFICKLCDASFSRGSTLQNHLRVHTGEKPYSCNICQTKFSHDANLRKHMRVHTGERPYSCSVCDKRFSQTGTLKRHLMRIHNVNSTS